MIVTDPAPLSFDAARLLSLADRHAAAHRAADPFPHTVIDDFLPEPMLDRVMADFPPPEDGTWERSTWEQEVKLASGPPDTIPASIRSVLAECNSAAMVEFLERLTGIEGLIPDPHLWGGGLHQIEPGGRLKIHADFNWHERLRLDRRLNLIIYLNDPWPAEWGGDLELWDRDMRACRRRVAPVANRCVVFNTTDTSFHGHPDPLNCPPGATRRSLALYYYTNGRPAEELSAARSTAFQPRPGEQWRRTSGRSVAARWLPPAVADAARGARRRLGRSRSTAG